MAYAFKEALEPKQLADELVEIIYPEIQHYLGHDVNSDASEPLTKEQMQHEFEGIFTSMLTDLRDGASALAMIRDQNIRGEQLRNIMYRKDSPLYPQVWRNLRNEICEFVSSHTRHGEHVLAPERAMVIFEKIIEQLAGKISDDLPASKSFSLADFVPASVSHILKAVLQKFTGDINPSRID